MLGKIQFPKFLLTTPVKIYKTFINEDGEPKSELIFDGMCNYTEESKQILDSERRLITLSGSLIVEGDIYPNKLIEGYIQVGEIKKDIFRTSKPHNPDGSVFSTELELM
jgi:hypothetical protein